MFETPGVGEFARLLDEERQRQLVKWGDQSYPDVPLIATQQCRSYNEADAARWRKICDQRDQDGQTSWDAILLEESFEAAAEEDYEKLAVELVQVAAVAQAWYFDVQRRIRQKNCGRCKGSGVDPEDSTEANYAVSPPIPPEEVPCRACGYPETMIEEFEREHPEAMRKAREEVAQEAGVRARRPQRHTGQGCDRCGRSFDSDDPAFDGRAQYQDTQWCRSCVDLCHDATDAFHVCAICR